MIVLDTHAWLWWVGASPKLHASVRRRIERQPRIGVAAISCWELATAVVRGRLKLACEVSVWIDQALATANVELLPLEPSIAVAAAGLQSAFGGDPADHIIIATARAHRAPLVTADERIRESGLVEVIWRS